AQKYEALLDRLSQKRHQLILFRLYRNQQDLSALDTGLTEQHEVVAAERSSVEEDEVVIKALKKEHGRLTREQLCMEKDIHAKEQKLTQGQSQYIRAKVNTSHHVKKAEKTRVAWQKSDRQRAKREAEMADIKREMEELDAAWMRYERGVQGDGASGGPDIQLEESQLSEYKDLKDLARKQTALLCQQTDQLHWEVLADHDKIALNQSKKKKVEAGIKNQQGQMEDLSGRAQKLEEYTNGCKATLEQYALQERSLSEELDGARQRSREVEEELGQVLEELGDARLDHQESRQQQRRKELLENLQRLYPDGVYGRLVDLCSPIHRKYQLAVTKLFGRNLNAIVVSTEKVARSCILYLKEERADAQTFLPIDYLDVGPLNERLRELKGARMVLDVVQCNPGATAKLKKVLQFVCGNAVVVENIRDARRVAFDGPQRIKTVALDGSLFTKSGVISGGSSDLRSKARCWEDKDLKTLKDRKNQLTAELNRLLKSRAKESELKGVQVQAQGVQIRLKYSNKELETLLHRSVPHCQTEISSMESELVNLDAEIQMQQKSMEEKQMEDLVFEDFCVQIGMDNIRQYEQEHLKHRSELDKKRLEFEGQRGRLAAQLGYEKEQAEQQQGTLSKLEETFAQEENNVAQHAEEVKRVLDVVEQDQNKLLVLKNLLLVKEIQVRDSKAQLDKETKTLQEAIRELAKQQRVLVSLETSLEQRQLAKHNLLVDCKVQGLVLTLISGDHVQPFTESGDTVHIYIREAQMVIDYSSLGSQLKVSSVEMVLQGTSPPNLKALEQIRKEDHFHEVVKAFNKSTSDTRKCNQEFEQLKAQRCRRFNLCFEHVAIAIDQIYKRLCRNFSAQAILSAENLEEPYLGGINYNCVSPGKRFMAMDNLSGGEKAIAALALLFAIHSFRPAPFFILDEVDAALDNTNIGKAGVLLDGDVERMQIIVISLKEEFYSQADALLGVYPKFNECMFSCQLTLDLRPYLLNPEDEQDSGTHITRWSPPGGL
ncbi:hypothetical protein NHX12_002732, partial [Muraenolepis orangiensis]